MTVLEELQAERAQNAASRFFLRIGQAGNAAKVYDEYTLPLFPLPLIMEAEGVLSKDARHLVNDAAAYLKRCDALIRSIDLR